MAALAVTGHEILALLAAVAVVAWVVSLRLHPYARCVSCKGRRGRNVGSSGKVWGRCRVCDGTGERLRFAARWVRRDLR